MTSEFVHTLLDAPDVKLIIARTQAVLADEAKRRQSFYEWLTDDIKAELKRTVEDFKTNRAAAMTTRATTMVTATA